MTEWREVGAWQTYRLAVPGGWLYRCDRGDTAMCFVPEPQGEKVTPWYASPKWMVICIEPDHGYVAATHKLFNLRVDASIYAGSVNQGRHPLVVELLKPLYEV